VEKNHRNNKKQQKQNQTKESKREKEYRSKEKNSESHSWIGTKRGWRVGILKKEEGFLFAKM